MDEPAGLTLCRLTVNTGGARHGDLVRVDLSDPVFQAYQEKGIVVPVESAPEVEDAVELTADELEQAPGEPADQTTSPADSEPPALPGV